MQQSNTLNYYEILGVNEKANYIEIKNAHRRLALQYHPDKCSSITNNKNNNNEQNNNNNNNTATNNANNKEYKFTMIQTAWECLSNETKRMEYDDKLNRIKERNNSNVQKAQIVKLSEMTCELCDVEEEEEDDDDGNNCYYNDCDQTKNVEYKGSSRQIVYGFTCRCGDTFEILEEELNHSKHNTNEESGDDDDNKNIFQCESCSLSIKIII